MQHPLYLGFMKKKPGPKKGSTLAGTNPYPFGQVLAKLRKRKGLTQDELAKKMGTSIRMISYYERAMKNPEIATIEKLVGALETSMEALLKPEKHVGKQEPAANRTLQRKLNLVAQLPEEDQKYVAKTIDMLAERRGLSTK